MGGKGGTRGNVTSVPQEMERGKVAGRRGSATVGKRRAKSIMAPACSCAGQPMLLATTRCPWWPFEREGEKGIGDKEVARMVDSHSPRGPHGETERGSVKMESTPEGSGLQTQRNSRSLPPVEQQPRLADAPSLDRRPNPQEIRKRRRWQWRMPPQRRAQSQ
jgi:hypothetical protein